MADTVLEAAPARGLRGAAVPVAYVTAMFMAGTDMHIVNVALPTLSRQFAAPLSDVQWTVISYLLALAVVIPASGWIADRVGVKQTFLAALALFTVASALCGAAGELWQLIGARVLQGVGAGFLTSSGTAMLYRAYPPEQRARVARTLILPVLIGPGLAPILGGAFTEYASWRWVFLINVPVGLATLVFGLRYLPKTAGNAVGRLDLIGLVLSGLGLSSILYAVSEGSALGWGSPAILISAVAGVGLLLAFVRRSLSQDDPILRVRLLGDRLFRATNVVFSLSTGVFLGSLYLTPIFLQDVLHQSPLSSGSTTFMEAVGVAIGSQTIARVYPRFGPRVMATAGAASLALYLALFTLVEPGTSLWLIRGLMLFGGLGNSAVFLAVQTAMFTHFDHDDLGHASAIYNTQRQSTIALNVAVMTTILATAEHPGIGTFHLAYAVATGMALIGVFLAVTMIRTRDAAATMRPQALASS